MIEATSRVTTLRIILTILAILPGAWMTFDGTRALTKGDYVTPSEGPYAGKLGPWSRLVAAVGIPPRSTFMKSAFVLFGLAWFASAFLFGTRRPNGERSLAVVAAATLWYLPVGTAVSVVELAGLAYLRTRSAP